MPLIGINPVQQSYPRETTLDKILKAVQIANGVTGTVLEVPKLMATMGLAEQEKKIREQELAEKSTTAATRVATTTREPLPGEKGTMIPGYGERVPLSEAKENPAEQKGWENIYKTHDAAQPNEPGAMPMHLTQNGPVLWVKPKSQAVDPETFKMETDLRNRFGDESREFMDVAEAYQRLLAAKPGPAGALSILANYQTITDPYHKRYSTDDVEKAGKLGSLPGRLQEAFNALSVGHDLDPMLRKDFIDNATAAYKDALSFHQSREDYYGSLGKRYGLNPDNIVLPIRTLLQHHATQTGKREQNRPQTDLLGNPL